MANAISRKLAQGDGWAFWLIGGEVYRAPADSIMDTTGAPAAKRWECSLAHWNHYRAVFGWAEDIGVIELRTVQS